MVRLRWPAATCSIYFATRMKARSHMRRVIELAEENVLSGRGGPFAALLVRGEEVVAEGTNLVTSVNDPTAHAEIVAIRAACRALERFELPDCVLFTSCEPCPMCMAAAYWSRIDQIYYGSTRSDAAEVGFDDDRIYSELAKPVEARDIRMVNLLREEAKQPFKAWADYPGRIPY